MHTLQLQPIDPGPDLGTDHAACNVCNYRSHGLIQSGPDWGFTAFAEQAKSLGAEFLTVELEESGEGQGGCKSYCAMLCCNPKMCT